MIGLFFFVFILALLVFTVGYIALLVKDFEISRSWGLAALLCPPVLLYRIVKNFEAYEKVAFFTLLSGLIVLILGVPIALFLVVVNIQANGHAMDRTQATVMRNHFQPIHEALLTYKEEHGAFPFTEDSLSVLPIEYFPENKVAWDTRLETKYGPIIYTLSSPDQYTLLVPTTESIDLWEDIDFTH